MAVIVFATPQAARRSRLRGRRPRRLPPGTTEPQPVAITRVSVIAADPFDDPGAAREWLDRCRGREEQGSDEVGAALVHINRAVCAYRVAAFNPHARDVTREHAAMVRLGYGSGSELVDGAWHDAYTLPAGQHPRRSRRRMLEPDQELAAILGRRRPGAQPSEELLLRARLDLEHGRLTEAAFEARGAAEALIAELATEDAPPAALSRHVEDATAMSRAALSDPLGEEQAKKLDELVTALERIVRRRRHSEAS